jgi:hypothetical protein
MDYPEDIGPTADFWDNSGVSNVVLVLLHEDGNIYREIPGHRIILASKSIFFRKGAAFMARSGGISGRLQLQYRDPQCLGCVESPPHQQTDPSAYHGTIYPPPRVWERYRRRGEHK